MMRVVAAQIIDMHGGERVIDEALEELVHEIDVERADQRTREWNVVLEPRPPGKIDDDARQCLVERNICMAETPNAGLVAERLLDRLSERDADVLDRVVRVDVQVALRPNVEVDQTVASHLIEHVIKKRHARRKRSSSGPIEVDLDGDCRLGGLPLDPRDARWNFRWCVHGVISSLSAMRHSRRACLR